MCTLVQTQADWQQTNIKWNLVSIFTSVVVNGTMTASVSTSLTWTQNLSEMWNVHCVIWDNNDKNDVYVASSFPKRKNTSDGQVFVQRCLKKTPIRSISVGHLFWSEIKKIRLPFSLLDTSFQLGWRVCVVLSCLFSWGIREGSQQKMAFCLQVTLTLGQRTWIIENGTLPLLNGAHLIWWQIVKIFL